MGSLGKIISVKGLSLPPLKQYVEVEGYNHGFTL